MPKLLLLEQNPANARVLARGLGKLLDAQTHVLDPDALQQNSVDYSAFDIALVNHYIEDNTFSRCFLLKRFNPRLPVVVLAAPGPHLQRLQELRNTTQLMDEVVERPVELANLAGILRRLQQNSDLAHSDSLSAIALGRHLPGSMSRQELASARSGDALLTEKTVLFADIRRSTALIGKQGLQTFFSRINQHFAELSELVTQNRGELIKYTGDGMLAIFSGFGRRYLGFRCARAILQAQSRLDPDFKMGLGLSDGLVMLGFIGAESRLFYDVIGTNVNIAARLCANAASGELLMTREIRDAANTDANNCLQLSMPLKGIDGNMDVFRYT